MLFVQDGPDSSMKSWFDTDFLPFSDHGYAMLEKGRQLVAPREELSRKAARSAVMDTRLFSGPGSDRFLPAICHPDFCETAHRAVVRNAQHILAMTVLAIAASLALSLHKADPTSLYKASIVFVAILAFLGADYLLIKRNLGRLQERALYFHFIFREVRGPVLGMATLMFIAGAAETLFILNGGTIEGLILEFGLFFESIERGQAWRYLTGPFIHANVVHWTSNSILACLTFAIATPIGRWWAVTAFFVTLLGSTLCVQLLAVVPRPDALVGISGGIFGLLGALAAVSGRFNRDLPQLLSFSVLSFIAVNVFISLLLVPNANETAHLTGAIIGFGFGLLFPRSRPFRRCVAAEGSAA